MRFLPGNAQHIGARHSQQDSFGFADPDDRAFIAHGGFLAVVCDGMGGMEHGDIASRTAVRVFLDAYKRKTADETIPTALERSVREANDQVVELAHNLGMPDGIGTTLVAAALLDTSLYFISVGDSGLFHCSGGEVRMFNHPHIFANMLDAAVARGAMSPEDAENHPEREALTSYIGAGSLQEIDRNMEPLPVSDGDTILLSSDGMFKTLSPDEIRACLEGPPQFWPETLVARTLAKKLAYQDNVTVLSVTLESESRAAAVLAVEAQHTEWSPPVQPQTSEVVRSPSRASPWPLIIVLLVFGAIAAAWWYAKHRPGPGFLGSPRITDPDARKFKTPPRDHPPDLTPDPNAPDPHRSAPPAKDSK